MTEPTPLIEEHRFTSSDNVGLRYVACGNGYPVVLSSPIGLHLDFWKPLFAASGAERYRFLALQSRGLWGSEASHNEADDTVYRHGLDIAELIVKRLNDVTELIKFRFRNTPTTAGGYRPDFGVFIGQTNLEAGLDLNSVTVHVNCFEDASRQILFLWRG